LTFSAAEVTDLAATQTAWMQDACKIGVYSAGVDYAGRPTPVYTLGAEIACGVNTTARAQGKLQSSDGAYYYSDAVIRLPLGTAIAFTDHITVTKRMAVACTNVEYSLMRAPAVGVSCITCMCRTVLV
jgi:hypothetical protein